LTYQFAAFAIETRNIKLILEIKPMG